MDRSMFSLRFGEPLGIPPELSHRSGGERERFGQEGFQKLTQSIPRLLLKSVVRGPDQCLTKWCWRITLNLRQRKGEERL
jgi:hypothetical protein